MDIRVQNTEEMRRFAADFVAKLSPQTLAATVVALSGELGAGKTTFAQAVARALGVEEIVSSPTFVIEKIYQLPKYGHGVSIFKRLVHIDAYRLKSAEELRSLGWDEIIADCTNLIVIEWPENVEDAIPKTAHRVAIEIGVGEERTISFPSQKPRDDKIF
jgi:tRNA threonylcarbamoyladenosine biosynthesis protein TsaE